MIEAAPPSIAGGFKGEKWRENNTGGERERESEADEECGDGEEEEIERKRKGTGSLGSSDLSTAYRLQLGQVLFPLNSHKYASRHVASISISSTINYKLKERVLELDYLNLASCLVAPQLFLLSSTAPCAFFLFNPLF